MHTIKTLHMQLGPYTFNRDPVVFNTDLINLTETLSTAFHV